MKHQSVVLFYKYFIPNDDQELLIQKYANAYLPKLKCFCRDLCVRLELKGRILLASEGINGTVSGKNLDTIQQFIHAMEMMDVIQSFGFIGDATQSQMIDLPSEERLFSDIDWKISSVSTVASVHTNQDDTTENNICNDGVLEPFPDLKISIVEEIISTGGKVSVLDIKEKGGRHISPQEFHQCLKDFPDAVLIDVRNTFEHAIGHFVHPDGRSAINPNIVTFSSFDKSFCERNAEALKNKKLLMFCTGGMWIERIIVRLRPRTCSHFDKCLFTLSSKSTPSLSLLGIRCEKASCMLRKRGVEDVSQLLGGIHQYLQTFGDTGFFRGKNFVFDQRVAQRPADCHSLRSNALGDNVSDRVTSGSDIVGKCIECHDPFDEICGSRVCTVCRDLVLVCKKCQSELREYHCARHSTWKRCFFTFLDVFDQEQLSAQAKDLKQLRETHSPACEHKNVRRTLSRQIEKVVQRIYLLESGAVTMNHFAPRRCRTCMETSEICDGRCWGFWKTDFSRRAVLSSNKETKRITADSKPLDIVVGDRVEPGPDWNTLRLGSQLDSCGVLLRGTVMEVKNWGAGGVENDCVVVLWDDTIEPSHLQPKTRARQKLLIYRWGTKALDNRRMYDLQFAGQ